MVIKHQYVQIRKAASFLQWVFFYNSLFGGTAHLVRIFGHSFYINYPGW
jgi:hypothetical protein